MEAYPERDPQLAAALRTAYGDPPEIDWTALRGRVAAQAELPLARRRHAQPRRWRPLRALVPLAAAAGIAGAAFALTRPAEPPLTQADRQQVEQILNATTPALSDLVTAPGGSEELLSAALGS
ncbi:MAG TPA: hypothetical protein VEX86_00605 [Longimicrobium sp.]|nr:hypothetical protein [Longimicrobium sp.]